MLSTAVLLAALFFQSFPEVRGVHVDPSFVSSCQSIEVQNRLLRSVLALGNSGPRKMLQAGHFFRHPEVLAETAIEPSRTAVTTWKTRTESRVVSTNSTGTATLSVRFRGKIITTEIHTVVPTEITETVTLTDKVVSTVVG